MKSIEVYNNWGTPPKSKFVSHTKFKKNPPQSCNGLPGAGIGIALEDRREDAALADELGKEIIADYLCGATCLTNKLCRGF